ncbi:helix-turn-helix domain-containing protein [Enterocloster sp. OA13]|nr:helix-turn-helix transcriptional regulator [Lachnoclostridium pacaense]MCC2876391.1 helix-turn-helix domain-containing protein [Lachnoclostridium pacaense]MCD8169472.1 helix-turn-helix domain-containing protein [Clostridiales bacterium]MCH1948017.1 helix-turn-helix domain-containing protein [Enterocloster sp. OA13]RJW41673.1 XRE family transcriptional regulator [Clostridiales bacterium TF09-2AC]
MISAYACSHTLPSSNSSSTRNHCGLSQRDLADKLQLADLNFDKNIITRIETSSRFVNDFELKTLSNFFGVSYSYLLDGIPTSEDLEKYPDLLP